MAITSSIELTSSRSVTAKHHFGLTWSMPFRPTSHLFQKWSQILLWHDAWLPNQASDPVLPTESVRQLGLPGAATALVHVVTAPESGQDMGEAGEGGEEGAEGVADTGSQHAEDAD